MNRQDNFLDRKIGKSIELANAEKEKAHKSSGKLSASKLGDPLLWQLLYVLGVPQKEIDEYTLRKFLRGNHVEEWLLSNLDCVDKQKFVEYRGVVGYADAIVDTAEWDFPLGVIPLEVKSTSNLKFKKIVQQGADRGHKLQAGLYALSTGAPHFAISYVATDDLRVHTLILDTEDVRNEIDEIITRFDDSLRSAKQGIFPKFKAEEKWQENPMYCKYPEFMELTPEEIKIKLQKYVRN